ncbi:MULTISPECIES: hypothetical protein [unclassified Bradyrhizobium]|uniref:hypothetical protein n=1 Tax=unclassified Bradyrhizobium TaxID=2631580 RepID=UPI001BA4A840|nr:MULTISPECIES: hypothetical protein [unclassified Bradyrhizobium]MBR1228902.1 hypothetical protein [Bradyrhizobium sp. AUGA SZCCT0176]MBR1284597.1 hypothetical protein [Bradyrhizobium sp. AUGA SZCCT0177]MBR1297498.1 hypothetical protein [Bradyrhizobium sp. AUGA SZCCT0042]
MKSDIFIGGTYGVSAERLFWINVAPEGSRLTRAAYNLCARAKSGRYGSGADMQN